MRASLRAYPRRVPQRRVRWVPSYVAPTPDPGPAPEQERFGGGPVSIRDLDRMVEEEQLVRLLREDEELMCLL